MIVWDSAEPKKLTNTGSIVPIEAISLRAFTVVPTLLINALVVRSACINPEHTFIDIWREDDH